MNKTWSLLVLVRNDLSFPLTKKQLSSLRYLPAMVWWYHHTIPLVTTLGVLVATLSLSLSEMCWLTPSSAANTQANNSFSFSKKRSVEVGRTYHTGSLEFQQKANVPIKAHQLYPKKASHDYSTWTYSMVHLFSVVDAVFKRL